MPMETLSKLPGSLPFFIAVFLNAFVDLGHKIVVQNTIFKLYSGSYQVIMTALINAMILLPFIVLLSPAGYLSDRYAKLQVMRRSGWVVVLACALICLCYYQGWFQAAFALTLVLAIQSAIFSPAKYGFIKEFFGKQRLGEVNGIVAALSIAAILAGTFAYSIAFESLYPDGALTEAEVLQGIAPCGWLLLASALFELVMMYRIPLRTTVSTGRDFNWKKCVYPSQIKRDLEPLLTSRAIRLSAIGLAVFWAVGQVMLAAFPSYLKEVMRVDNTIVVQGVLACSGLGIAIGSVFAGRYSRNYIETGLLPLGALGLAAGLLILPQVENLWIAAALFLLIGVMGGIFIVPLNALIQYFAPEHELGKTLAASNWLQNMNMLLFLLITVAFSMVGWTSRSLLQLIGLVALVGAVYTLYELPQSLTRFLLGRVVSTRYRIQVQGMKHIPAQGGVLLLGNHVSWIDWAIVQIASPRPVRFVMISTIYELWYLKWFFQLFGCIPIQAGAASRTSLELVASALRNGEVVCLFPEGVISRNGHLAEFRRGYERACNEVDDSVVIVPFYLRGLWGSFFSRSSGRMKRNTGFSLTRDVVVDFGKPLSKSTPADVLKRQIQELSDTSWREYADNLPGIGHQWVDSCKRRGNPVILIDTMGAKLTARMALTGSVLLGRQMKAISPEQNVGLLLPSSTGSALGNMALSMLGKTVVNLNFTAPAEALLSAVLQSEIKTIYTSSRFIDRLQKRGINLDSLQEHCKFIMLEEVRANTTTLQRLLTLAACWALPASMLKLLFCKKHSIEHPAVILFSSGSEGFPKGVILTHRNLLCNVKQIAELLNLDDDDVMLANLPPFHAFGLTVTHYMPLLERVPVVCHADPTDVYGTAIAIAEHKITTMFGTSSFYRLYNRNTKVHPLMLDSLRLVIAGAEKLQDEVRRDFKLKFNKDILEGYGATETAPVASVNMPDQISPDNWKVQVGHKVGSVGLPLPGTSFRIVDPDTLAQLATGEAGMILISGAQVMQGYYKNESKTRSALQDIDGKTWYVTGDKGYLDQDGFLFIQDRYSRFAKISGEMVGLGTVEAAIRQVKTSPDFETVVVNVPDEKKGEKLVALTTEDVEAADMREGLIAAGLNTLAFPAQYFKVDTIPKLGSGKTDFATARKLVFDLIASQLQGTPE